MMPSRKTGRAFCIDIIPRLGYTIYRKWCYRQTVPPLSYKEVTVAVEGWRLLLFISNDLNDQSEKRNDEGTKLKQLGPCNHIAHPLFFTNRGQRRSPPKTGEPPTVPGSTIHRIPQRSTKCNRKAALPGGFCLFMH